MATVPSYSPLRHTVALIHREEVADGTMAFHFARPAGFDFKAGQSLDLTLLDPPQTDAEGNTRAFSIASAPYDADLMIATRMRDTAFKRVLKTVPLGTEVQIEGPSGSFTLHNNAKKPAVFLIGGIGITPVLSMLRQAAHDQRPHALYLFYANRRPEDAAFLNVLEQLRAENANFHLIPTMSQMDESQREWRGERGVITQEMIEKNLPSIPGPIYYLAGPPGMVAAMRRLLQNAGADEDDIRTEEFPGY